MVINLLDAEKRKYRIAFWYGHRHYARVITGTRKLAQDIESKMRLELAEGRYFPARQRPNLSFAQATDRFLTEYAAHKPSSTYFRQNLSAAKVHFGSKLVNEISPEDVRQYKVKQKALGLHPVTVNHRQKTLRRLFSWLADVGLFGAENPASSRKVSLENERPYWRRTFLTVEQYNKLLEVADPRLKTVIVCAAHTGMRLGELKRMKRADVHLDRCSIFIPESKNGETGSVPITDTLFGALEPIIKQLPRPDSLVLDFSNFNKLWRDARAQACLLKLEWAEGMNRWQKAKANKNFHFHDLRHTAASYAIMGSRDPYAVQNFLRLKTQSLMQRYAHLHPGHVRQAALTLDSQLSGSKPKGALITNPIRPRLPRSPKGTSTVDKIVPSSNGAEAV